MLKQKTSTKSNTRKMAIAAIAQRKKDEERIRLAEKNYQNQLLVEAERQRLEAEKQSQIRAARKKQRKKVNSIPIEEIEKKSQYS